MSLDDYNGVKSTIIDEWQSPVSVAMTRNGTFIFGTAKKGPKNVPVAVSAKDVVSTFGEVPLDASFETSAVRGLLEFSQSSPNTPDVYIVRVGKTAAARVELYENIGVTTGDLSYTLDTDGNPSKSLWIEAVTEGSEYNKTKIQVTADASGYTNYINIELPDGTSQHFNLYPYAGANGVISSVSELVAKINASTKLSGLIKAGFDPLVKEINLDVTADAAGVVNTNYNLDAGTTALNESWGDKLISITSAYQTREISQDIDAGSVTEDLTVMPTKLQTAGTRSIHQFIRKSSDESVLTVTPMYAGKTGLVRDLYCKRVTGWNKTYDISGNVGHGWTFKLKVKRNGSSSIVELPSTAYTLKAEDGTVTINETYTLGDIYYADYRYEVSYTEAKLRSELATGNDKNYFIFGGTIVFGAEQPMDMTIYYTTKVYFNAADIEIINKTTAEIEFINSANLPKAGSSVTLVLAYEPELPAPTGSVLLGKVVQPGSLTGGDDGRLVSKKQYLAALLDAMEAVDLYPRRHNLVMGLYLDDSETGYNEETGLPETRPMNMVTSILPYIERACNYTNECDLALPVRPPVDLSQKGISTWITRLIENSDTDLTRPANVIDSLKTFRVDVPVGAFVVSIPEINGGAKYLANPASIFLAAKANLEMSASITNAAVPGNVDELAVKIFNADIIGKINAKRYTAAVVDYNGNVVWADGPTCAISGVSQFDRQFVRDTVYLAVSLAREVALKYIGKPRKSEYLMALRKDVGKALQALAPDVISDMFVEIVPVTGGNITGKTKLRMMLTTTKEIRSIEIVTQVKLGE